MPDSLDLLKGKRRQGSVVNIAAAGNANGTAVLTLSTYTGMVGAKTLVIKRIMIRNNGAGNTYVHIGTGAAGSIVDAVPALYSISGFTDVYPEDNVPQVELNATIMAYSDAVGGGSFDIQVEAEERG